MSLKLDYVNKSFNGQPVIKNLSLHIPEGEVFGFLGPNGAGKTTTMRMVLDIFKPDTGTITWRNHPTSLFQARSFGYLPEERGLYPKMKVLDQLRFFARLKGLTPSEANHKINYWAERFQLGGQIHQKANELSKGNQQKVQFIAAILHNPDLLILDEPFSGLDPINVELLKTAFVELAQQGKTIIFSSHRMDHVEELCTSLGILKKGELLVQGSVGEVRRATGRQIIKLNMAGSRDFLNDLNTGATLKFKEPNGYPEGVWAAQFDLPPAVDPQHILTQAMHSGQVNKFEVTEPSIHDIFISLVGGNGQ